MTTDVLHRRYGRGAARLALAAPGHGASLARLARSPVSHELPFAALPTLACLGVAALVAGALPRDRPVPDAALASAAAPTQIRFLEDVPAIEPMDAAEPPISAARPPAPEPPAPRPERAQPIAIASEPDHGPDHGPMQLELTSLATPAPTGPGLAENPTPSAGLPAGPRPIARSANRPSEDLWSAAPTRRAQMAALELDAAGGVAPVAATRRPTAPVAAGGGRRVAAALSDGKTLAEARSPGAGWREVPLESLPDCSPPGRQDRLKQRIALASVRRPECTHREASYRFVETRNLGAFLMWTRSTASPSAAAARRAPRDACEVLEAALRCLQAPTPDASIKESASR